MCRPVVVQAVIEEALQCVDGSKGDEAANIEVVANDEEAGNNGDKGANGEEVVEGEEKNSLPRGTESHWLEYNTLMGNTLPLKSKVVYLKAYADLENYLRKENQFVHGVIPSEHAMLNYFFFLKNVRQLAPSTIWYSFVL